MRGLGVNVVAVAAMLVMGCSSTKSDSSRTVVAWDAGPDVIDASVASCTESMRKSCPCFGAVGFQTCEAGAFGACECPADAGTAPVVVEDSLAACDPGVYEGTFSCTYGGMDSFFPLLVEGPVGFDLQANEMGQDPNCEEFCLDLVIKEGSSKLFGLAGLTAFESTLTGGLDCSTGEFRAEVAMGEFGGFTPVDPNDPNGPLTIAQPPFGHFTGVMGGLHNGVEDQAISGNWSLAPVEFDGSCDGPFMVTLNRVQP